MEVKQSISEVKFVPVLDGQLAYEVAGNGPVVLCLPSLGDTRREYERLAPELAESGYRVITTDLRGMGQSRGNFKSHSLRDLVNDIQAILDAEQVKEAFLLGCSVSGASAGLFAIEHPAHVSGLVLFSPIMRTGPLLTRLLLVSMLRIPGLGRMVWGSYFKTLYPAKPLEQDYMEHIQTTLRQPGAMKSVADMCMTPRIDNQIAQIRVPTLIYLGTRDPDFKDVRQEAERLKGELPQAQVIVLEGAGHYPQREFSDRVAPEVVQWLNGARSGAASQR